ncbi:unnamed protein product [Hyaloperonospora brassicae]|uniref:Uncharacterized protein n=1 Tax=Hyaloperonospora brassicae TaxID=162125 RepID=A0AAV0U9L1_HYABA|nr:unnamed protein product [Hyaloperonospora brassicae]
MDTSTRGAQSWLKSELTSALGFAEVDEIVAYITSTFRSKQEASSYLIELLGIPATRAEHISTRLFSPEAASPGARAATVSATTAAAVEQRQEKVSARSPAVNARPKSRKKTTEDARATTELLNSALVVNCLRCGRIEYDGGRRCTFCSTELRYEAEAATTGLAAQQHMEELPVRLDETGTRRLDAEQCFYDEDPVEAQRGDEDNGPRSSSARRPIATALAVDKDQVVDVRIACNEQLSTHAREIVDRVTRNLCHAGAVREPVVVVDDSSNLLYV